jgi:hypothetical protein
MKPGAVSSLVAACAVIPFLSLSASAASLLLDFGTGAPTGAASGADGLISPGHQSGGISSGENTWNYIDADNKTSLVFGDNTAATGVSVITRGETADNTNIIDYAAGRGLNLVAVVGSGVTSNTIYSDNRPARNAVFTAGTNSSANAAVGSKITGLAAGTYSIYVTGRNTNNNANAVPQTFYLSTAASSLTAFQFAGVGNTTEASGNLTNTVASLALTTHSQGVTYAAFENITLGENESIFLATEGTGANELRGFINSIEIVLVPEPSAAALVFGSLSLLAFRRRRA